MNKVGLDDFIVACGNGKKARGALLNLRPREIHGEGMHIPLAEVTYTASQFAKLEIPEREKLIPGVLECGTLNMVFGKTGIGKSQYVMAMLARLAEGEPFLAWPVTRPCRVLLIDGEMPTAMLRTRLFSFQPEPNDNFCILLSEELHRKGDPLNLNEPSQQQRIWEKLEEDEAEDRQPDVIVFDNLSSLAHGTDENSNSDLDTLLQFFIALRHRGYSVIVVHHAGKDGSQRGASRREDFMDTVTQLSKPTDDVVSANARFSVTFTKMRGPRPEPDALVVELETRGNRTVFKWDVEQYRKVTAKQRVLEFIRDNTPGRQTEIIDGLNLGKATVSEQIKALRVEGYLPPKPSRSLAITPAGEVWLTTLDEQPERKF